LRLQTVPQLAANTPHLNLPPAVLPARHAPFGHVELQASDKLYELCLLV
jgi:hypothetical protein